MHNESIGNKRLGKELRQVIARLLQAAKIPEERIAAGLAAVDGTGEDRGKRLEAIAVPQARVCELLSCSRHHVRKLEREGLLKAVLLGGLKRYPVDAILRLLGRE